MNRLFHLFLVLLLAGATASAADIKFRHISDREGLPNNHVNAIFRDSHGYMWFGTASGLTRFDGYSMRIYYCDKGDSTSIHDNFVQGIQETHDGRLLIQAGDRYGTYDPRTDRFARFDHREYRLPDIPNLIKIDGDRTWFAIRTYGIYILRGDGHMQHLASPELAEHDITALIPDMGGKAIVVNNRGEIYGIDRTTLAVRRITQLSGRPQNTDYQLFADADGRVWVYGYPGVDVLEPTDGWRTSTHMVPRWSNRPVYNIAQDADRRIWVGYDNEGLEVIDTAGNGRMYTYDYADHTSLGNNSVRTIYNDSVGGMWIGTYKKGVSVYFPSENKFDTRAVSDVNCIIPATEEGWIWLGTDHEGLIKYNPQTGTSIRIPDPAETDTRSIVTLADDGKGGVWTGTYNGGLKHYGNGRWTRYTTADGMSSNSVWAIDIAPDGILWLGTLGGGLQQFNPATGKFGTPMLMSNSALPSHYINSLYRDRDNDLYAATPHGIARIDTRTLHVTRLAGTASGRQEFCNQNVNQVIRDSRGLMWVGTREGLDMYDMKADTIYNVQLDPKFSSLFILGIIEGRDRSMWVTAGGRLFNIKVDYDRNERRYAMRTVAYDARDGLQNGTFNQRSMCLLPTGEILAGNAVGVTRIDPESLDFVPSTSRIIFTALYVGNDQVEIGGRVNGNVILPSDLPYMQQVRLRHNQNDISVYFATDNYSGSERTEYQYLLEGHDSQWQDCAPGTHSVRFTNLTPGKYRLYVRTVDSDGVTGVPSQPLDIIVSTPWWATWWAYTLYTILAIVLITAVVIYLRRREQRIFAEHQREEQARKNNELNELKFKFFTNISHELRTPLTLILSPVESMIKESTDEHDIKRLGIVKSNATRLLHLVNQLLDFRKNEMAGLTLHLSQGDLVQTVRQMCNSFVEIAERRSIQISFNADCRHLDMEYDADKISKTVMNLLSNAVKYAPNGGRIDVNIIHDNGHATISVADNGKGISETDKAHIFERFYRSADASDLTGGTGIGLSLVYEYVMLHGGSITVTDNNPTGSVFTLTLPRVETHTPEALPEGDTADADQPELPAAEPAADKRPRVLFVDDNTDLTDFLRDEFARDYDISVAADGAEALEAVKSSRPDIIVTDIMMPNMDGIQLCRALKSNPDYIDIPLIMLTAKQDATSMIEGLTIGADDYITKPFNNDILGLRIRRLLALRDRGLHRTIIEPVPDDVKITSLDEQLIDKAVKYVEENMGRSDLTVEQLSQALGMSRVHLYKKILTITGKTPIEFIRVLRLKRAAQYLRESQLSVAEIAYKIGFNNPKYFSKYFREEFGISPSDYVDKKE